MDLNRRQFIKIMGGTAAAFSFAGVILQGCKKSIEKASKSTPIIWLQGQSCSGCSVSFINSSDPPIVDIITQYISLNFHQTLCGGTSDVLIQVLKEAVSKNRKDYVLVVEGAIPVKSKNYCTLSSDKGHHISIGEWVDKLARNAKAVVAVGTCAAFGGIPAARGNVTGAMGVTDFFKRIGLDKPVINISGCPSHPDWIFGTLAYFILKGKPPALDEYKRPLMYFGKTVHENCSNLENYKKGIFAIYWGDIGCLYKLGCLGMDTGCDIPVRKWNDGANTCTKSGAGCLGCTEPVFPDTGRRGLYEHIQAGINKIDQEENPQAHKSSNRLQKMGGVING